MNDLELVKPYHTHPTGSNDHPGLPCYAPHQN
jgi:hypothetical protein